MFSCEYWRSFTEKRLEQMFSFEFCEIFKNNLIIEHIWWLHLTPIRYTYVTPEWENNEIRLKVKYTAFAILRKRK